jgi:hypothetical protein
MTLSRADCFITIQFEHLVIVIDSDCYSSHH